MKRYKNKPSNAKMFLFTVYHQKLSSGAGGVILQNNLRVSLAEKHLMFGGNNGAATHRASVLGCLFAIRTPVQIHSLRSSNCISYR